MILNPFTEPVHTKLIKVNNNFALDIFDKMLSTSSDSWSSLSLTFLKKLKGCEEEQLNNKNFDINLILKLLLQLSTIKNINNTSGKLKFIEKNIEYVIKNYLKQLNVIDNKSYCKLNNILFQIENTNYNSSIKGNNNLVIRTSNVSNDMVLKKDDKNIEILNNIIHSNEIARKNDFNNKRMLENIDTIKQINLVRENIENINFKNVISETINNSSRMLKTIISKNLLLVDIIKRTTLEEINFKIISTMILKNINKNQDQVLIRELLINVNNYKKTLIKEIDEIHLLKEDKKLSFKIVKNKSIIHNKTEILEQFRIIENINRVNDIYTKERKLINILFNKSIEHINFKNVISETINNSSRMLKKTMNKNFLLVDLIRKTTLEEMNFKITSNMIFKNTNKNQENILAKELLINIHNYKKTLIKDIDELSLLKHNNISSFEISRNNKIIHNKVEILDQSTIVKNFNILQDIYKKESKLINLLFKEDKLKKQIIEKKIDKTNVINELINLKNNFIEDIILSQSKIDTNLMIKANNISSNDIVLKEDVKTIEILNNIIRKNDFNNKKIYSIKPINLMSKNIENADIKTIKTIKNVNLKNTEKIYLKNTEKIYLKSIENINFKNIISEIINNNNKMLQKIIDKNLLAVDIIKKRTLEEINFGITYSIILKNTNRNNENNLSRELLINIYNYKKNIIKEIEELHILKEQIKENKTSYSRGLKIKKRTNNQVGTLEQFQIIKNINIVNNIYKKQRKLINISFKEDELRNKIIKEKINKANLRQEIKKIKNEFLEEELANEIKENIKLVIKTSSVSNDTFLKEYTKNTGNLDNIIYSNKSTQDYLNNKKIYTVKQFIILNKNNENINSKNIKTINLENTKEIIFKTIVNSSIMLQKLMNKNLLIGKIIRKRIVAEVNFTISPCLISKNLIKNQNNILEKEILIDIGNYKTTLIKEIEELNALKEHQKSLLMISKSNTIIFNKANILDQFEIIQNLNIINDIYKRETKLINISFIEDEIKKQIIEEKSDKAKLRQEIKKIKNNFIEETMLSETKLDSLINNVAIHKTENRKSLIMNRDIFKNVLNNLEELLINHKKFHIKEQEIKEGYTGITTMRYKKNITNDTNYNAEQVQFNENKIDEQQINKVINENVEKIIENKLSSIQQGKNQNDEEKINDLTKKVIAKIEKTLDYEKRRRGF